MGDKIHLSNLMDVGQLSPTVQYPCGACGCEELYPFYDVGQVPTQSVLLIQSYEDAIAFPTGSLSLVFCLTCGFISNPFFDSRKLEYSDEYEETQGFSPTFNEFQRRIALSLIERYGLKNKKIIEIGCGKGEFLALLCDLGDNTGVGFDPAYVEGRISETSSRKLKFIKDFYSEKYADYTADIICCKMTLEHIDKPAQFVRTIRASVGEDLDTIVFFQVPNMTRILRDFAYWDIYYEHCSYFTPQALTCLFEREGFDVLEVWCDYGDQYLMIEALPSTKKKINQPDLIFPSQNDLEDTVQDIFTFRGHVVEKLDVWGKVIRKLKDTGSRVVLWGSGSKAVAFLTKLGIKDEIQYIVDINPFKHNTYSATTGQEIVAPSFLQRYRPDVVIVMNPVYQNEIKSELEKLQVQTNVYSIESNPAELI